MGFRSSAIPELRCHLIHPDPRPALSGIQSVIELRCRRLAPLGHGTIRSSCGTSTPPSRCTGCRSRARTEDAIPTAHAATAMEHLTECMLAADRMDAGIGILEAEEVAWRAFQLASQAMLTVRSRADWQRSGRPDAGPGEGEEQHWFPFQLGFILLCVAGLVDPKNKDRDLVDLLWFPTGGGKTEAYLGLVAFTVFLRRLRLGVEGAGVTALMRYTLRLLTIQQFEREAALICACEHIRRSDKDLSNGAAISLGLWVGGDGTPNTRSEAERNLKKIRAGTPIERAIPSNSGAAHGAGARWTDATTT